MQFFNLANNMPPNSESLTPLLLKPSREAQPLWTTPRPKEPSSPSRGPWVSNSCPRESESMRLPRVLFIPLFKLHHGLRSKWRVSGRRNLGLGGLVSLAKSNRVLSSWLRRIQDCTMVRF